MLAKRIVKMFFSNKEYPFAMLINIAIVLALFVMFLGDQAANNMEFLLGFELEGAESIVIGVVFGGLLGIICTSACLGALQIIVEDWEKAAKDFHVSPVSRAAISRGYLGGSIAIGIMTTLAGVILCLVYMAIMGGGIPTIAAMAKLVITVVLSSTATTTFLYFIIVCINSPHRFNSFSNIFGILIGFLMGVYVPIVMFPDFLQLLVRLFPLAHSASMFRSLLADDKLAVLFQGAEPGSLELFRNAFGLTFDFGTFTSDFMMSAVYLAISTVVFYVLSVIIVKKRVTHE